MNQRIGKNELCMTLLEIFFGHMIEIPGVLSEGGEPVACLLLSPVKNTMTSIKAC